jgi:uncharacterized membrane protein YccC
MSRTINLGRTASPPLTERQKDRIFDLAEQGYRDRQIANIVKCSEHQAQTYRQKCGIHRLAKEASPPGDERAYNSSLRPRHVQGAVGDEVWFRSNDEAFRHAVRTAGGW